MDNLQKENITIVGSGAMGRAWSSMLYLKGYDVNLIAREASIAKLREFPKLTFTAKNTDEEVRTIDPTLLTYDEATQQEINTDTIIYAVRGPYLSYAVKNTASLANENANIVFTQGGLPWFFGYATQNDELSRICDPDQTIKNHFESMDHIFACMISFGSKINNHNTSLESQYAPVLGAMDDNNVQLEDLQNLLNNPFINDPTISKNFVTDSMKKAIASSAMHGGALRAYYRGKNGMLGDVLDPNILDWMVEYADTARKSVKELGIEIDVDYLEYFNAVAGKAPDIHMVPVSSSEFEEVVYRILIIAESLGSDMRPFKSGLQEALIGANKLRENNGETKLSIEL